MTETVQPHLAASSHRSCLLLANESFLLLGLWGPEVAECTTNAAGENSAVGGLLSRWRCTTVAAIEESPVGQSIIDSNNNKLREIG